MKMTTDDTDQTDLRDEYHPDEPTTTGPEHEYVLLSAGHDPGDVRYGVRYYATVNNVKDYGVFVTVAGRKAPRGKATRRGGGQAKRAVLDTTKGDQPDPVWGLVHKSGLPRDRKPGEFERGDAVGVVLYERKDGNEGDERLNFEMVAALETTRGFEFERDPYNSPWGRDAATLNDSAELFEPEESPTDVSTQALGTQAEMASDDGDDPSDATEGEAAESDDSDAREEPDQPALPDDLADRLAGIESALTRDRLETEEGLSDLARRVEAVGDAIDALRDEPREDDDSDARDDADETGDDWPGKYALVVGLLRDHADAGRPLGNIEYDESGETTTLTVEVEDE